MWSILFEFGLQTNSKYSIRHFLCDTSISIIHSHPGGEGGFYPSLRRRFSQNPFTFSTKFELPLYKNRKFGKQLLLSLIRIKTKICISLGQLTWKSWFSYKNAVWTPNFGMWGNKIVSSQKMPNLPKSTGLINPWRLGYSKSYVSEIGKKRYNYQLFVYSMSRNPINFAFSGRGAS